MPRRRSRNTLHLAAIGVVGIALLHLPQSAHGFAAWLKCFVDLDETEVIMNNQVLLPEDAPRLLRLQIKSNDNNEWITTTAAGAGDTDSIIQPDLTYSLAGRTVELRLPTMEEDAGAGTTSTDFLDLQFVMEASKGGSFVASTMCEGRRTHGKYGGTVTVRLDGQHETVQLWAGWAVGHQAVSLTPKVTFVRTNAGEANEL